MADLEVLRELERQLADYREKWERSEKKAEQAQNEKEQALKEKEQVREETEQIREETEQIKKAVRQTTLREYLHACQVHVLSQVELDTTGYLTTKVPSTNPTNKHCPRFIQPWDDFIEIQQRINTSVDHIVPHDARLFESVHFLETAGRRIHNRPVHGEKALAFVQSNAVEDPVRIILDEMKDLHPERQGLALFGGVQFQTTASSLRDKNDQDETAERDEKLLMDQVCVLRGSDKNSIVYVIEYKAPHRLHTIHLDKGLRPMNIYEEVVNKPTIPKFDPEKAQHYAELLTAAAITQTYHYMLEAGLEYGCLANGDAMVFLKIDWSDPTILLYHLAQPSREVEVDEDPAYSNAVCQLLAFTILALQSQQHGNDERAAAVSRCQSWTVDFHDMVQRIAQEEGPTTPTGRKRRRVPSSPDWLPSPIKRRRRSPEQHTSSDRAGSSGGDGPRPSSGDYEGGYASGHGTSGSTSGAATAPGGSSGATQSQGQQYCTPLCLLSLMSGRLLDRKCPNATLHSNEQQTQAGQEVGPLRKHPVSYAQWMALLQEQLSKSLEKGVVALRQEGACGALFQVTLLQYGYTFVAKGVTGRAVPQLQHEEAVYQKLQPLQGRHIPVCLGSVDLRALNQVYYYWFDVRIIRFLLLSYGGAPFGERPTGAADERLQAFVNKAVREMRDLGVIHGDLRIPNVLQGPTGHFTLIDFDQARLLPSTDRDALGEIAPNKRKRLPAEDNGEGGRASYAKQVLLARLGEEADSTGSVSSSDPK